MDYLTFALLDKHPEVRHAVFTRHGGTSRPPFDSLNVSFSNGDDPAAVEANRQRILTAMGFCQTLYLNQVHGSDLFILKNKDNGLPASGGKARARITADGVISDVPGCLFVIQVADCQAVMLLDPERRVIANIHSGWRGSIADITGNAVDLMIREFGCNPADILAGIGPSLGPCCGEFIHFAREIPEHLWGYRTGEHHFDFWKMTRDQLTGRGVLPSNIDLAGRCTRCRPDTFFSFRAEKETGRFACAIGLVP